LKADHQRELEKLRSHKGELAAKLKAAQDDLNNTEAVQKDFVRLSQNLQVGETVILL